MATEKNQLSEQSDAPKLTEPVIDFAKDLKSLAELPWPRILLYSLCFGLLVAFGSFLVGLPELIKVGVLNYSQTGDALGGRNAGSMAFASLLAVLLITIGSSASVICLLLINGSKTIQFIFLCGVVGLMLVCWMVIAASLGALPLICLTGAILINDWDSDSIGLAVMGVVFFYPAMKCWNALHFTLVNYANVFRWVYRTVAKYRV
ncbi:MAG: hypothetical protein VX438_19590 [Planctomycetota bacterium]|nr:hypothetical protein [Planctomycetota bacterium]